MSQNACGLNGAVKNCGQPAATGTVVVVVEGTVVDVVVGSVVVVVVGATVVVDVVVVVVVLVGVEGAQVATPLFPSVCDHESEPPQPTIIDSLFVRLILPIAGGADDAKAWVSTPTITSPATANRQGTILRALIGAHARRSMSSFSSLVVTHLAVRYQGPELRSREGAGVKGRVQHGGGYKVRVTLHGSTPAARMGCQVYISRSSQMISMQ